MMMRIMHSLSEPSLKKRKLILSASLLCLTIIFFVTKLDKSSLPDHHLHRRSTASIANAAIVSACKTTLYPDLCESSLASSAARKPADLFDVSVELAVGRAHSARSMAYNLTASHSHGRKPGSAPPSGMDDCLELLDISLDQLNDVLDPVRRPSPHDVKTWLSAALTNQATCADSLASSGGAALAGAEQMNQQVQSLTKYISNALALHDAVKPRRLPPLVAGRGGRRLLGQRFPAWVTAADRRLLDASPAEIRADAVVAQDGSGTHASIGEAIAFVSLAGTGGRSVIYVKAGTYKENINIPTKQKNVMLMGDGKGKSVIVGSRNAEDGSSTYSSATVAAMGAGFIGKGLTIINSAGPSKHQAVALRVGADKSVVTQCSIQGYQDTLYTHSNRQFYRDNDIYGTVDFIFGNSAVVFQNCLIQPRKPAGGQRNSVTAQGRSDPNQNTGISIHACKIQGSSDLGGTPTYLGRPWHQYSRVVIMSSYLDDSINPAGWEQWSGSFALNTLYYAEYANTGPGSSTSSRVGWKGVHPSISSDEASKFTVGEFIYGDSWLPGTGVDYNAGL